MPHIDFVLPHWLYWLGLLAFPLIAMALARRGHRATAPEIGIAYFCLVTGGMLGLHRFYLKNLWGFFFIPVFLFILYANAQSGGAREEVSSLANIVRSAERVAAREEPRVAQAEADLAGLRAAVDEAEAESFARRSAEKRLERAQGTITAGQGKLAEARRDIATSRPLLEAAQRALSAWNANAKWAFWLLLAMMAVDAVLLPHLTREARFAERGETLSQGDAIAAELAAQEGRRRDADFVSRGWTGAIDRASLWAGEFVSYWAVIAVFVYYFEVISRYVFNSPTNWAHEAMYLMFGMQYLIAGSYAMLTEQHVRVDIFYANFSPRRKALVDLMTSVFFFIFAGTLLVTSWIFAMDALAVPTGNGTLSEWARGGISTTEMLAQFSFRELVDPAIRYGEISFNEWEIPLWPMKWVMTIGALLLVLQGISHVAQNAARLAAEE